jgi:oligopeptide transport system substrate-binding protein
MYRLPITLALGFLTLLGVDALRSPSLQSAETNSIGKVMPEDAAPLDKQHYRYLANEPTSLDITVSIYTADGSEFLYEPLTVMDENNQILPGAAERWKVSEDGLTWTFYFRPNQRWSDGHPLTAGDFEYALKRALDPMSGNVYPFPYYVIKNAEAYNHGEIKDADLVGIQAIDDLTLSIETALPCPYLPLIMSYKTSVPVPEWQVEKYGNRWSLAEHNISNSSYKLVGWLPGQRLEFELNPYYDGPHKGYLERITRLITNAEAGISTGIAPYENNEVEVIGIAPMQLPRVKADPVLSKELYATPTFQTWYLFFQNNTPPFDDVKVRQAIAHAIDRETITRVLLQGMGTPAHTMLPPGFPGYVGDKYRDIQAYNPKKAKQLLAEAGYPNGRGFPRVECWLRGASRDMVAEAIQGMLSQNLGIDIKIVGQDRKVYVDNMYQYRIPMSLITFVYDYVDPHNMLGMVWHTRPKGTGRHDWSHPEFDRLVTAAASEMDLTKRMQMYDEAERILSSDAGGVFIYHGLPMQLRKPWLKGFTKDNAGYYSHRQPVTLTRLFIGK